MGSTLTVDSNPCYMAPSRSPSPFFDSGTESDDVYYMNDGDEALSPLKKGAPLSKKNEYVDSYLEHEYEFMERDDDEYQYVYT